MDINSLSIDPGEDIFYSKEFMDVIESHLDFLRTSSNTRILDVDPKKADIYNKDLFGFLMEQKIPSKYHWCIMRLNYMYSSYDFGPVNKTLYIFNPSDLEKIRSTHVYSNRVSI